MRGMGLAARVLSVAGLLASVAGGVLAMRVRDDPEAMKALSTFAIGQYGGKKSGELQTQVSRAGEMLSFLGNGDGVDGASPETDLADWYASDAASDDQDTFTQ